MVQYSPAARIWTGIVVVAAFAMAVAGLQSFDASGVDVLLLVLLGASAAVAHVFPIRSAVDGATYRMTNVFLLAGALLLPPGLLSLLPALAMTPDSWRGRRRPGVLIRWLFNVSQAAVAAHLAGAWVRWAQGHSAPHALDLPVLLVAAALFTVVQAALVGLMISFNSRVPFTRTGTLAWSALQGEALVDVLAIVVAGLWLAEPALLVLVVPVLVIAHRMTRTAHLAHLAQVDVKTGLHNWRHFERALDDELSRSVRVGRPLALLFVDLDHFKRINDAHGHAAGDLMIREVAALLTRTLRKGDVVARFGGEEFVALLPGTDADEAMYLAERLRAAIEAHRVEGEGGTPLRCTASVGVAVCPDDAADLAGLVKQADTAMYRAKQTRNAVARPRQAPVAARLPRLAAPSEPAPADTAPPTRSPFAPWLLRGTLAAGLATAAGGLAAVQLCQGWLTLLPFLAVAVAAEFLEVRVYEANQERISFSFTILVTMAAVAAFPPGAPLVSLTAALVHLLMMRQRNLDKALFNLANPTLAAAVAAGLYLLLNPDGGGFTPGHLGAALAAVVAFHVANFGVVSLMISLHTGRPLGQVMARTVWYAPTKVFLGLTGAFLGGEHAHLGLLGVAMFAVPVLIMRFTLAFYARSSRRAIATLEAAKAEVEEAHREKEETLHGLIEAVSSIIDAREPWVLGHSRRVAAYAVALGQELGLSPAEQAVLHTGGLLHDLGKVGIPETILNKPGRLTEDEYAVMKGHAEIGERILAEVRPLATVKRIVGEHHERYDGAGYPRGRRADEISLGGRIVAVADALDAILSDRPYSRGRDLAWALAEMHRCAGAQFDPEVVAALRSLAAWHGEEFFTAMQQRFAGDRLPDEAGAGEHGDPCCAVTSFSGRAARDRRESA